MLVIEFWWPIGRLPGRAFWSILSICRIILGQLWSDIWLSELVKIGVYIFLYRIVCIVDFITSSYMMLLSLRVRWNFWGPCRWWSHRLWDIVWFSICLSDVVSVWDPVICCFWIEGVCVAKSVCDILGFWFRLRPCVRPHVSACQNVQYCLYGISPKVRCPSPQDL